MNWEEYQNSDFYREAHPERFERRSEDELKFEQMASCVDDIKDYYANDEQKDEECEENGTHVTYVAIKLWNSRFRGILTKGSYEHCRMKTCEYNIACIGSEWDSAGIERIEYEDEDELSDIICGYMDDAMSIEIYGDEYYDY